jgi:hypothetical protein
MEQTIIRKRIDKKDSAENKLPEKQKTEQKLKLTRRDFLKGIFAATLGFAFLEKKINDFQRSGIWKPQSAEKKESSIQNYRPL